MLLHTFIYIGSYAYPCLLSNVRNSNHRLWNSSLLCDYQKRARAHNLLHSALGLFLVGNLTECIYCVKKITCLWPLHPLMCSGSMLPFLIAWLLYQGSLLMQILNWTGLLVNGSVAFLLPLVLAYKVCIHIRLLSYTRYVRYQYIFSNRRSRLRPSCIKIAARFRTMMVKHLSWEFFLYTYCSTVLYMIETTE